MSTAPFLPLAVPDFVADTLEMDAKEVGAYMLLLMSLWQRKGYLPNDHSKLKRVARIGRDWPKVWAAMGQHFEVEGDRIFNIKLLEIVTRVADQRLVNAHSGALGGRAKALKEKKARLANATISAQQLELEPDIEVLGKPKTCASDAKIGFAEFWEIWPSKKCKAAAEKAWAKLPIENKRLAFSAIRGGWFDRWQAESPRASPIHASSFLNGKRWEDEPHKLTAINGGYENGKPASKSAQRIRAWTEGARGTFNAP